MVNLTVCCNYRTVYDRLWPVAHSCLIKQAPRSPAWPRRGSKWIKLSDKHFTEWKKRPNSSGRVVQSREEVGMWMWDQAKDAKRVCNTMSSKQRTCSNTETVLTQNHGFLFYFFLDRNLKVKIEQLIWTIERRFFPVVKGEIDCCSDGSVETTKIIRKKPNGKRWLLSSLLGKIYFKSGTAIWLRLSSLFSPMGEKVSTSCFDKVAFLGVAPHKAI